MKKIALLTGGGDCAGINSFIAAAVRHGIKNYQADFLGIKNAFAGACAKNIENYLIPLSLNRVTNLEDKPSTILESSRFNPFKDDLNRETCLKRLINNFEKLGIDAILATGGNDTIKSCFELSKLGFQVLAAPKSIDNDVSGTDVMLGYRTAVNFGSIAVKSASESAKTHRRISIVEIMGRDAGWLALEIGISAHADVILIPEKVIDLDVLIIKVNELYQNLQHVNIVIAEGVKFKQHDPVLLRVRERNPVVKALLEEERGFDCHGNSKLGGISQILRRILQFELNLRQLEEVRVSELGFILRGLPPNAEDIVLGTKFGTAAIDLLHQGISGKMIGLQGTEVRTVDFKQALIPKPVNWNDGLLKSVGVLFQEQIISHEKTLLTGLGNV